jgi:hypothetical protein
MKQASNCKQECDTEIRKALGRESPGIVLTALYREEAKKAKAAITRTADTEIIITIIVTGAFLSARPVTLSKIVLTSISLNKKPARPRISAKMGIATAVFRIFIVSLQ